jgi:amino acid adenylation domain-containing protein
MTARLSLIHSLVEDQATATPDAPAIVCGSEVLTYQELNTRANQVAQRLQALGVAPEIVVGMCLERSPAMIVAALGILKSGGAYLPLDPSYPEDRLALMLDDARAPALITAQSSPAKFFARNRKVITLDHLGQIAEAPTLQSSSPANIPGLQHLAYVIYTSGSTGQPKGVEISHASLLNLVEWHQNAFRVTATDRASQVARVGFDAVVWEVWPYLAAGASLHITPEEKLNDPEALRDWLVEKEITISFVPTPMAERLLALRWPTRTSLRVMLTGADALHTYPPEDLPFLFVNNYGPTECTVVATSGLVAPQKEGNGLPAIGRAIANTQLYVLDESLHPVEAGAPGELYIGGIGVGRGYRNQPRLTAERFIPNPFKRQSGERFFKTGDLVKSLPDGQLSFLGRIDEQIKVRGFRVEPDEVAAALNRHPAVLQSVVVGREIAPGERRLVAYLVVRTESAPLLSELRKFLSDRLPDFMIPATFVVLENLPLSANGKIERTRLPVPDEKNTLRDRAYAGPRTDVEQVVSAILAPLLGLDRVDVEENFFTVGGHSLLGTQLIARIRDAFQVELPLRKVFEAPTVAQLSAEIERLMLARLEMMSDSEAEGILKTDRAFDNTSNPK